MSADARQDEGGLIELIRILQFGDSTFPVGAFSFSCGLETAIQTGVVRCAETLREFTMTAVEQAARGDAIALVCAHAAAASGDIDELCVVDEAVFARKISEEARTMTTRMGKKFTELSVTLCEAEILHKWRERVDAGDTPGCHPVALGVVFAVQNLSARSAFVVHQYGVASTILSAALRLLKVSHMDTQKILYEVNRASEASFAGIAHARLSDMAGFSPVLDILAAIHTKAHVRLFMN